MDQSREAHHSAGRARRCRSKELTLVMQQRDEALVGDAETARIEEQEQWAAGGGAYDVVEDLKDRAVVRRGGDTPAGVLVGDHGQLRGIVVFTLDEEAGRGAGAHQRRQPAPGGRLVKVSLQIPSSTWPSGPGRIGATLAEIARTAEASGFDSLAVPDQLWQHPWPGRPGGPEREMLEASSTLAFLAAHTSRVKLLTMVTNRRFGLRRCWPRPSPPWTC
jgi:hypothetical protein